MLLHMGRTVRLNCRHLKCVQPRFSASSLPGYCDILVIPEPSALFLSRNVVSAFDKLML